MTDTGVGELHDPPWDGRSWNDTHCCLNVGVLYIDLGIL
jgi:hypothetical protein